ncbi:B12-binding domain-containing radical SAM protein [Chloroflexota bacterium]
MKVLFIYTDICTGSGRFQQGIASISSVLKKEGHRTSLLHITKQPSKGRLRQAISNIAPNLIGFSTTTNQYPYVQLFSRWIKEHFDVPIICGGVHPTLVPEEVISDDNIDIVCLGEGEYSILELANGLEKGSNISKIQGLWVKLDGKVYKNPIRPLIQNLDELPFPDRDLFGYESMLKKFGHTADFITGRGCPYDCSYCCNHSFRKLYRDKGKYVRRRSTDNVLAEIDYVIKRYKVERINYDDDTFTLDRAWIKVFCEGYAAKFGLPFICNARPETLDQDMIGDLKAAGCELIQIGIESGSEYLRRQVLRRNITNENIIKTFEAVHRAGIATYSFNMVGIPSETPEMAEETIELNQRINPDDLQVSIFYPYPGTELYQVCEENGLLASAHKSSYFDEGVTLKQPSMTEEETLAHYRKLNRLSLEKKIQSRSSFAFLLYRLVRSAFGQDAAYIFLKLARASFIAVRSILSIIPVMGQRKP